MSCDCHGNVKSWCDHVKCVYDGFYEMKWKFENTLDLFLLNMNHLHIMEFFLCPSYKGDC